MRREEILGLDWSDVKDGYISVNKVYASTKGGNSNPILKEPKTKGSKRQIPISPTLEKPLRKHKAMQGEIKTLLSLSRGLMLECLPQALTGSGKSTKKRLV